MSASLSIIVATYNQPALLERCLWGYARQIGPAFELLVADDGSSRATGETIERVQRASGLRVRHVWHDDRGFRKTEILNRAILASSGEYLIFSDGDCVPRHDFVATHARLAEPGRFLSGGALRLTAEVSESIAIDDVTSGRCFHPLWLIERGWRPGHRAIRLLPRPASAFMDAVTPTRATWNGGNASTWKSALLEVNGYDGDMGYGGLDRALGERLRNLGIRGKQIRYRAPLLHLHHDRPYVDPAVLRRNREIREEIRRERRVRARVGIEELAGRETQRSSAAAGGA